MVQGRGRGNGGRNCFGGRMSGGRGSGGRVSSNNNNKGRSEKRTPTKIKEIKFNPQIMGETTKHPPFVTVQKHPTAHMSSRFGKWSNDIAQSFEDEQLIELDALKPVRDMGLKPTLKTKKEDGSIKKDDELAEAEAVFRAEIELHRAEQSGRDVEHQVDLEEWKGRKQQFNSNLSQAVSTVLNTCCTRPMQNRIQTQDDCDTMLKNDPVKLLLRIRTLQHEPNRNTYAHATLHEKLRHLVNVIQGKDEDLIDYILKFKTHKDMIKGMLGDRWLDHFVEQTAGCKSITDASEQEKLKAGAFERFVGYTLMEKSDHERHGSLIKQMNMNKNLDSDSFPSSVNTATERLSSHELDNKGKKKQKDDIKKHPNKNITDKQSTPPEDTVANNSFGQLKGGCYICGSKDHLVPGCPDKDKMKNRQQEWCINKANAHYQDYLRMQGASTTGSDESSVQSAPARATNIDSSWAFHGHQAALSMKQQHKPIDMKHQLTFDSASSVNLIGNTEHCSDIQKVAVPMLMGTNNGHKILDRDSDISSLMGAPMRSWCDPEAVTNILAQCEMKKHFRMQHDSDVEDAYVIHLNDGTTVKFECNDQGLYVFTPKHKSEGVRRRHTEEEKHPEMHHTTISSNGTHLNMSFSTPASRRTCPDMACDLGLMPCSPNCVHQPTTKLSALIATVEENRKRFTERQCSNAKRARELCHMVGAPTTTNYKLLIQSNMIKNCPVTTEDINVAEAMFGPDLSTLKGKTTRRTPKAYKEDHIEIPKATCFKYQNTQLCIDGMFVNGMAFLASIDKTVRFRATMCLPGRKTNDFFKAIEDLLRLYNSANFMVTLIHCDPEFKPVMDIVESQLHVKPKCCAAQAHVPEAERDIRTNKERIRVQYHRLPYSSVPRTIIKTTVLETPIKLNMFPAKGGISSHFSPTLILDPNRTLDCNKHFVTPVGAYVQAPEDDTTRKNAMQARMPDCICLRPLAGIGQTGHEIMDMTTGRAITRDWCKTLPLTNIVKTAVEQLAEKQGVKGLKFTDKRGRLTPDPDQTTHPDWIEGVDSNQHIAEPTSDDDCESEDTDETADMTATHTDDEFWNEDDYDAIDNDELQDLTADETMTQSNQNEEDSDNEHEIQETIDQQEENQDEENTEETNQRCSRRTRTTNVPLNTSNVGGKSHLQMSLQQQGLIEMNHNILHQTGITKECASYDGQVICLLMTAINDTGTERSFAQQCLLKEGLRRFGDKGEAAALKEVKQLHERACFQPAEVTSLTQKEKIKAMNALMFLCEKRDGTVKAREACNGKPAREWVNREDSASPTASHEALMLTGVIDVIEKRDIMCIDAPNAFIQSEIPKEWRAKERTIMKITGPLVDFLVQAAPHMHQSYVVHERGKQVLCVEVLRAIYGMLVSAPLWFNKFSTDLESYGFKFNPYDPCVANKIVNGKQQTTRFHVDDVMSSHVDKSVNDTFYKWLNNKYGKLGKVTSHRGESHDYLGAVHRHHNTVLELDNAEYIKSMMLDFQEETSIKLEPVTSSNVTATPAIDASLTEGKSSKLNDHKNKIFHRFVAKGLCVSKRGRPDIQLTVAVLCT